MLGGGCGVRVQVPAEQRGEAPGSQQPQRVLLEAHRRIADSLDDASLQVAETAGRIKQRRPVEVEVDRVAGEVAAPAVQLGVVDETDSPGPPMVLVIGLGAERGDDRVARQTLDSHSAQGLVAEVGPKVGPTQRPRHGVGLQVGGDVEIRGHGTPQQIADGPAHQPGAAAHRLQPGDQRRDLGRHLLPGLIGAQQRQRLVLLGGHRLHHTVPA